MLHLLQVFLLKQHLMVVWLNWAIIVLCQRFCYINDIRIHVVIWIIYKMLPQKAERTRLQKSIVALQNLALSGNLAPPCPSENPILPDSKAPPQLLKSIPQSYIFAVYFMSHIYIVGVSILCRISNALVGEFVLLKVTCVKKLFFAIK